ncbi:t43.4 [Tupaiid betaherpesvirus 1]|uniref:T43.4 n=1 Tax=Tupaiid herpesvirus 1 (strain 1) TaxID=10397 RepID=Q91TP6_TUHV1|nr:t43.4 [Tupaiid betaherpesvirus 1]AAK57091.1 t43.4 [Tupaiid betaherpesvirus 1]
MRLAAFCLGALNGLWLTGDVLLRVTVERSEREEAEAAPRDGGRRLATRLRALKSWYLTLAGLCVLGALLLRCRLDKRAVWESCLVWFLAVLAWPRLTLLVEQFLVAACALVAEFLLQLATQQLLALVSVDEIWPNFGLAVGLVARLAWTGLRPTDWLPALGAALVCAGFWPALWDAVYAQRSVLNYHVIYVGEGQRYKIGTVAIVAREVGGWLAALGLLCAARLAVQRSVTRSLTAVFVSRLRFRRCVGAGACAAACAAVAIWLLVEVWAPRPWVRLVGTLAWGLLGCAIQNHVHDVFVNRDLLTGNTVAAAVLLIILPGLSAEAGADVAA